MGMLLVPSSMSFMVPEAEAGQEKETVCSAFARLCDEEAEHYVMRYITEPEYKAWFDRNFSDYTIYEGIGITELQYQEIVNNLTKPQPAAEQKTVTTQESSGGLVYVLVAVVAVGGGIGAIFFIKKGSKSPKPVQQESSSTRQSTVLFCGNCGSSLKPEAKFCGKCGSAQS